MSMLWLLPPSSRRGGDTTAKGCHWPGHQVDSLPQVPAGAWPRKPDRMRQAGRPGWPITVAVAVRLRTNSLRGVMGRGGGGVRGLCCLEGCSLYCGSPPTLGILPGQLPAQPPWCVPSHETAHCRHVLRGPALDIARRGHQPAPSATVNCRSPGVPHQNRERHSRPRVDAPVHHVAPAGLHRGSDWQLEADMRLLATSPATGKPRWAMADTAARHAPQQRSKQHLAMRCMCIQLHPPSGSEAAPAPGHCSWPSRPP